VVGTTTRGVRGGRLGPTAIALLPGYSEAIVASNAAARGGLPRIETGGTLTKIEEGPTIILRSLATPVAVRR
jgi:hypothetical protein